MFDHVGMYVSDLARSAAGYDAVLAPLGLERVTDDPGLVEWGELAMSPVDAGHALTRNLHIAFRAPDRAAVDAAWQAGIDAGWRSDGEPGPRPRYGDTYHGGVLLDPDGNSVEALHGASARHGSEIDHLSIRVADVDACRAFYLAVAAYTGFAHVADERGRARFASPQAALSVVAATAERPATEGLHVAFPAHDHATVDGFHAAGVGAGGTDHGGPGERARYHPGYYGAFVLDPGGTNAEVVDHGRG